MTSALTWLQNVIDTLMWDYHVNILLKKNGVLSIYVKHGDNAQQGTLMPKALNEDVKFLSSDDEFGNGDSQTNENEEKAIGNVGGPTAKPSRTEQHGDYIDSSDLKSYISTSFRSEADMAQRVRLSERFCTLDRPISNFFIGQSFKDPGHFKVVLSEYSMAK
ncbi:Uncharacterized protein TCM_039323 [Theobroma cacao]|uniref:Uncharacterized protein n=1 Tax=Theobroma cacao TaxID=3641 RepID=A0A061GQ21_THECC|nr:Uncharacterized protein TCM_039323 [Theobroma cacao]